MRSTQRIWTAVLSFAFAVLIAATPMLMAKKKGGGGGGGGGGARSQAPTGDPVDLGASNTNNAALTTASSDLATAQAKLKQVTASLWATFEQTPEWVAAEKAVADAQAAYDAACKPVLAALQDNPDFKAASDSTDDIDAKIEAARDAGDQDTVIQLAQAKLTGASTVTKMTNDALNADPGVASAKQNLTAAKAAEDQLRQKFQTSLASNSDYTTAKQAVDDAQTKLASARGGSGGGTSAGAGGSTPKSTGDGADAVPDVGSTVEGTTGAP